MSEDAWLRVRILNRYPRTGEMDVEIDNCGETLGVCVQASDVVQRVLLLRNDTLFLGHLSDCALHSPLAYGEGPCDCGAMREQALAEEKP